MDKTILNAIYKNDKLKKKKFYISYRTNTNKYNEINITTSLIGYKYNITDITNYVNTIKQIMKFNYMDLRDFNHDLKNKINTFIMVKQLIEIDTDTTNILENEYVKMLFDNIDVLTEFTNYITNITSSYNKQQISLYHLLTTHFVHILDIMIIDKNLDIEIFDTNKILQDIYNFINNNEDIKSFIFVYEKPNLKIVDFYNLDNIKEITINNSITNV